MFALTAIAALFVTSGIGVFHVGVEQHWWAGPQDCSGRVPAGLSAEELKKYLMGAAHGPLRRAGLEDVEHLDGRLERDPVGRPGLAAVLPRAEAHPGEVMKPHEDREKAAIPAIPSRATSSSA